MRALKHVCFGRIVLAISLLLEAGFAYWLVAESDDEKVHNIFVEFDSLLLQGKRKEAHELFAEALSAEGDGPLNPIWSPLVRAQGNGYVQLDYYVRILAGDPDRESTYKEIANLIEFAPEAFHKEVKSRYFAALNNVPGVRFELLEKYKLTH